jgi:hypothetical protein
MPRYAMALCSGQSVAGFYGGRHFSKFCIEPCVLSTKNLVTALSTNTQAVKNIQACHDTGIMIHKDGTGMVIHKDDTYVDSRGQYTFSPKFTGFTGQSLDETTPYWC